MAQLFANNATTVTVGTTASGATSISVANGAAFPSPAGGDYFIATLIGLDVNGNESSWEIVKCTARIGNTLTVARAQEGTSAAAWPSGSRIELRVTAGALDSFANAELTMLMQKNRIDANWTIPNGINAVTIGPFEVNPDVIVTGLGNSTWRGL